jgi:hypothetical protein
MGETAGLQNDGAQLGYAAAAPVVEMNKRKAGAGPAAGRIWAMADFCGTDLCLDRTLRALGGRPRPIRLLNLAVFPSLTDS